MLYTIITSKSPCVHGPCPLTGGGQAMQREEHNSAVPEMIPNFCFAADTTVVWRRHAGRLTTETRPKTNFHPGHLRTDPGRKTA